MSSHHDAFPVFLHTRLYCSIVRYVVVSASSGLSSAPSPTSISKSAVRLIIFPYSLPCPSYHMKLPGPTASASASSIIDRFPIFSLKTITTSSATLRGSSDKHAALRPVQRLFLFQLSSILDFLLKILGTSMPGHPLSLTTYCPFLQAPSARNPSTSSRQRCQTLLHQHRAKMCQSHIETSDYKVSTGTGRRRDHTHAVK